MRAYRYFSHSREYAWSHIWDIASGLTSIHITIMQRLSILADVCGCAGFGALSTLEMQTFPDIYFCNGDCISATDATGVLD